MSCKVTSVCHCQLPIHHRSKLLVSCEFLLHNLLRFLMQWGNLSKIKWVVLLFDKRTMVWIFFSFLNFSSDTLLNAHKVLGSCVMHGRSKFLWLCFWALKFTDSNNGGHESYGNGKRSRGCTNGWKRSKIQWPPISIYSGILFSLDKMDILSMIVHIWKIGLVLCFRYFCCTLFSCYFPLWVTPFIF